MNAQENIARWQVQTENLKKERELLKNCERRLSMELDSVRREQTSQTMLLASLQAIQTNQERAGQITYWNEHVQYHFPFLSIQIRDGHFPDTFKHQGDCLYILLDPP